MVSNPSNLNFLTTIKKKKKQYYLIWEQDLMSAQLQKPVIKYFEKQSIF